MSGGRADDPLGEVRWLLRRLHGAAAEARPPRAVATGLPALDALLLGGGLARGRLTALAGPGGTGLAHRAVAAATRVGTAAWLDPPGRLAGLALLGAGADLAEVIVARPAPGRSLRRAIRILLETGAVDLLVVDLPDADEHVVRRLAQLARLGATATMLLTEPRPWLAAAADAVLLTRRAAWRQDGLALRGCELAVTVARQRGGRAGDEARVALAYARPLPPLPGLEAVRFGADAGRVARRVGDGAG
ncbi:MAG: hypothetical protein IT340_22480 [Chloroflexi bacterium]|nr:hypothetical protein [Chloroflexota bacterium]